MDGGGGGKAAAAAGAVSSSSISDSTLSVGSVTVCSYTCLHTNYETVEVIRIDGVRRYTVHSKTGFLVHFTVLL